MAIYHIHYNEAIFEDPHRFDPERWLQSPDEVARLSRFMVAFSRGSRSCLGINLAYMEMYMAIGYLIRRFDFKLAGTTPEDMMWDDMVPWPV
jgi:cytochrome P450